MEKKTMSQRKREQINYRYQYFKRNPGLFGCIWFCSQCYRPLIGKSNVQVDHIVPLASHFGQNRTFNCVAICPKCNQRKKAKMGVYTLKGQVAKVVEVWVFSVQRLLFLACRCSVRFGAFMIKCMIGLVSLTLRSKNKKAAILTVILYAAVIYCCLAWWR